MEELNLSFLAQLVFASGVLSLVSLLALHFVSPEYQPSWRMISEYALGKHKWLITSFFILWGVSSLFLSLLLWNVVTTWWGYLGVVLLFISAIGEIMGGLFDIKHKWHGMAFGLGVPSLPIAALLVGYNLLASESWRSYRGTILISSYATWISLGVMAAAMGVMFAGFRKAGIVMDQHSEAPDKVPDGVIALGGYANRMLVLCYVGWLVLIAYIYLSIYSLVELNYLGNHQRIK
jgi:hypothetical protein